ncbi:MAG TPA: hypothetical protein VN886_22110 [Acidimicrobiales bacterium]|nr:hypothetical protein [Acidimicrobiales bacterium]
MAHETSTGSSPIVKGLMNNLREILPDEQRQKLDAYEPQAEASSPKGDYRRARHCLHWAVKVAESPDHSHLSGLAVRLKEKHKAWQDVWLGAEFGSEVAIGKGQPSQEIKGDQKIGPGQDIELLWVEEATDVAKGAAEKSGWDAVPWEELLQEVLKIT